MPSTRYSRFVRLMRVALPIGAVALLALLMLWPRLQGPADDVVMPTAERVDLERDGRVRLDQPRYVGEGANDRPFSVRAEAARVDPMAPRRIELERMHADLPTGPESDVAVAAGRAVFDRDRATLDLAGGIEVITDDGFRLETEAAEVAIEAGRLQTHTPVFGRGPDGDLAADRLEVEERGSVLRFSGNVRVRLPAADEGPGS